MTFPVGSFGPFPENFSYFETPWPPDGNAPRSQLRPPRRSGGQHRQSEARATSPWRESGRLWGVNVVNLSKRLVFAWIFHLHFSARYTTKWEILPLRIQDSRGFNSSKIEFISRGVLWKRNYRVSSWHSKSLEDSVHLQYQNHSLRGSCLDMTIC